MTPVYVINRDVDGARWGACEAAARAQGVDPIRISALDGHAPGVDFAPWRGLIGAHFWGEDRIKPGALACAISHHRAWEAVAAGPAPWALILEDDALLTEPPARAVAVAGDLGCDVLFANPRLAAWTDGAGAAQPLAQAIARGAGAPGADAYVLSREGAARLIAALAELRVVCGVDWAMVWAGLDSRSLPARPAPELALLARLLPPAPPRLTAQILTHPLVRPAPRTPSVLRHRITLPLATLPRP